MNSTGCYEKDFPYMSPCGPETNYIRCDDVPVVFTHLMDQSKSVIEDVSGHTSEVPRLAGPEMLTYGGTGGLLTVPFQPEKLAMLPGSGRIYHCGPDLAGGVGLVKSSLALELSPFFEYRSGDDPETSSPVRFRWKGESHELDNHVLTLMSQNT